MTELQKYYVPHLPNWGTASDVYLASEADAHIAALKHSREDQENTILHLREELSCALQATDDNRKEVARLTECLKKANANHEHFEREWYLRGNELEKLQEKHAEEIERLNQKIVDAKAAANSYIDAYRKQYLDEIERQRKQAERYEKLRRLSPARFATLHWDSVPETFDELVDALPSIGQASIDERARRTE